MSDNDSETPAYIGNGEMKKKKRIFQEKVNDQDQSASSQSRSPSPDFPSRLDKIPSPSYGQEKSKSKSPAPNDSCSRSVEKKTSESRIKRRKNSHRSKSRSPRRKHSGSRSRSKSPKRKHNRSRSRSKSPRRKRTRSKSRSRSLSHRRREGKKRKRSRSRDRRRRSRSRSRDRRRRSRSRERKRSRSRDRRSPRRRSPKRHKKSRSQSASPPKFTSKWGLSRAALSDKPEKGKEMMSTADVEKRLAEHMKTMKEKAAEEAKKINLPGYLNPAMINVHQYKQVQDKRKLLWSKPKDKKEGASQWAGAFSDQNNDEKFKRLMGIQGVEVDQEDTSKVQQSRKVLDELEKEYEKSRAFQMSRGAGGLTGIGLGFGAPMPPQ